MSLNVTPIRNRISFRADNGEKPSVSADRDDAPRKEPVISDKKEIGSTDSFQKEDKAQVKSEKLSRRQRKKQNGKLADKNSDVLDEAVDEGLKTDKSPRRGKIKNNLRRAIGNSVEAWEKFLKFKARSSAYAAGLFNGVVAGLGVGGSIMALDWAMNGIARISRKEATSSMYIKEPAGLVTGAFKKVFKGIYALPDKTVRQIAKDFVHSPVSLYEYVKNAPNVSKIGKTAAPLAGGVALAYCLARAVLRANSRVANIEHAFSSGHAHDLK